MDSNVRTLFPPNGSAMASLPPSSPVNISLAESHRLGALLSKLAQRIEEPAASVYVVLGHIMKQVPEPTDVRMQYPLSDRIGAAYLLGQLHCAGGLAGLTLRMCPAQKARGGVEALSEAQVKLLRRYRREIRYIQRQAGTECFDYLEPICCGMAARGFMVVGIERPDPTTILVSMDYVTDVQVYRLDMTYRAYLSSN